MDLLPDSNPPFLRINMTNTDDIGAMERACVAAWDAYNGAPGDAVHPMFLTGFKDGYDVAARAAPAPAVVPAGFIQPDHLQKAQRAPFLCRVEPSERDDLVPIYLAAPAVAAEPVQPKLKVRLVSFAESNGKRNWTALLVREQPWGGLVGNCGGISLARGELWNRVAYEAQCAMYLIGDRDTEPYILDFGDDIETPDQWKGETDLAERRARRAARVNPTL